MAAGGGDAKAEGKVLPAGALTGLPKDYKELDGALIDELLSACGLWEKAPLKDPKNRHAVDWKPNGVKNGCAMFYAQTPGTPYYFFKGVNVVPASVAVVEHCMRQIENMRLMDPMCKATRSVKHFDRDHHIYWAAFKMPPMISDRDFCWFTVDANLPDGTYVTAAKSLVTPDVPNEPGHVRGEIRASGYVVEPVPGQPDQARVHYVVQTNPAGWLPAWVVNFVAASQAYNPGVIKDKAAVFLEQMRKAQAAKKQEDEWKAKAEADRKKREAANAAASADAGAAAPVAASAPKGADEKSAPADAADAAVAAAPVTATAAPTAAPATDAAPAAAVPVASSA